MDYLILNDIPTPWREPVFERVYQRLNGCVRVVYFKGNEKRRLWTFRMGSHPKTVLRGFTFSTGGTERFFNPGLLPLLVRTRPRVALLFASIKDPSGLMAMSLCRLLGTKVALLDDSWMGRDRGINRVQKLARRLVYNSFGDAFVGTSRQTLAMFKHYNPRLVEQQMFLSHLVADNEHFRQRLTSHPQERRFDVMFSGRIVAVKNPVLFAEVCAGIKQRMGRCRALIIGEGDEHLKAGMRAVFAENGVEYEFAGFISHDKLPDFYAQARLLLLPTSGDCWGVVINEAMLAGTPVVTTELTAAAGELVLHERNGLVLPLDKDQWIESVTGLLQDRVKWQSFSGNAESTVKNFNYDTAATGILEAFRFLEQGRGYVE